MNSFYGTGSLPSLRSPVVTVGSFDGVHRGHMELLDATVNTAKNSGRDSIAVTFDPHPRKVLKPSERTWLLSTLEEKLHLLSQAGLDYTVVIPFDEGFSRMGYADFIRELIEGKLNASAMVVGYDHRFGHNKEGDYNLMQNNGVSKGLELIRIPEFRNAGIKISSTEARRAVNDGDMAAVFRILGHPYIIIGIPAPDGEIIIEDTDKLLPANGNYPVRISGLSGGNSCQTTLTVSGRELIMTDPMPGSTVNRKVLISFL